MDETIYTIRVPKKWLRIGLTALITTLVVAPITAYASHVFNDVGDSNVFHEDITWLAETGVTKGCNPPANDRFCPGDNVTREQMAAFMRRLAENRVVQAATADVASDSETLDGLDSTDYALATELPVIVSEAREVTSSFGDPPTVLAEVTLEAPTHGVAFIQYMVEIGSVFGGGTAFVEPGNDGCSFGPDAIGQSASVGESQRTHVRWFPVEVSAGTHSFQLCGLLDSSGFEVQVDEAALSALFLGTSAGT